ncbi:hypothetical protein, partial [Endozoicomonas ascidiicola]|uniref:hypothetical protein n=2 Tax=Endozoicomonas ascidiicola TaxID=1698521 RepID=UPI001C12AB7F
DVSVNGSESPFVHWLAVFYDLAGIILKSCSKSDRLLAGIMRQKKHEIVQENRQKYEKALKITEQLSLKGGIAVAGRNSLVKQLRAVIESIASNDEVAMSILSDLKELEQNNRVLSIYSGYRSEEWIKIPLTKAEARDREDAINDFTAVIKEVSVENDEVISRIKAKLTNL